MEKAQMAHVKETQIEVIVHIDDGTKVSTTGIIQHDTADGLGRGKVQAATSIGTVGIADITADKVIFYPSHRITSVTVEEKRVQIARLG